MTSNLGVFLVSLSIIVIFSSITSAESSCPPGWEMRRDTCYKLHGYNLTFFEARIVCSDFYDGASLLNIKSHDEQLYVMSLVFHHFNVKRDVWLGLIRINDTYFRWIDGSVVNYTNWGPTEPSDKTTFCVAINQKASDFGKWYDRGCRELYPVVCQKNATDIGPNSSEMSSGKSIADHLEDHKTMMSAIIALATIILILIVAFGVFFACRSAQRFPSVMTYKNVFTNNLPLNSDI